MMIIFNKMKIFLGFLTSKFDRLLWHFRKSYQISQFKSKGENIYIGKNCIFTPSNIILGNDVFIGSNACFQSSHGKIVIGHKVMIGPNVHIHGGNHKVSEIGKYMIDVNDKAKDEDGVVKICDDVWIGACSIILKGVTIGEGSIIGAGSIITKDVAPYSIIVGSLERKEFSRFSSEEIKRHKELLAGMKTDE